MGAKLVSEVLMRWACVPDKAFRVLIRMAQTALDDATPNAPAGVYFGGGELLMTVIPADEGVSLESRARAVKRAVADLVAMGAVERVNKARSGSNQIYRLTLNRKPLPLPKRSNKRFAIDEDHVDNFVGSVPQGDTVRPPERDTVSPPQGDTVCPLRGTPGVPPRNHEEGVEEKYQEKKVDLPGPLTLRAHEPPKELEFIPPKNCGNPECVRGWVLPTDPTRPNEPCRNCNSNVIPFREKRTA